jgi:hypothetical protein
MIKSTFANGLVMLLGYIALVVLGTFIGVFIAMNTGCTNQPTSLYNLNDTQDKSCYATYGSAEGYCDKRKEGQLEYPTN